jgi:hypothetical protein
MGRFSSFVVWIGICAAAQGLGNIPLSNKIYIYIPICYLCIILASEECRYLWSLWWVHYLPSKQICVMWDMRVWAQVTYIIICARILCDMCHRMHFV